MAKLFAIKEVYSNRIYDNQKKVEFRRQDVNVKENESCLVYTSSPTKRITGYFIVERKLRLPIAILWARTKEYAGITKEEFLAYFQGCIMGTAIIFKSVKRFMEGISLEELKDKIKTFSPPQSYYNLKPEFVYVLKRTLPLTELRYLNL